MKSSWTCKKCNTYNYRAEPVEPDRCDVCGDQMTTRELEIPIELIIIGIIIAIILLILGGKELHLWLLLMKM